MHRCSSCPWPEACVVWGRLQHEADQFTKQADDFLQQAREARRHAVELDQQLDNARTARCCQI